MPTEGQALDAMLQHAASAWMPPGSRVRVAHRVFARDGWRCTAPGCSVVPEPPRSPHRVSLGRGQRRASQPHDALRLAPPARVHARLVCCAGAAPDPLRFELGVRGLLPPLLTFAPGERLVRWVPNDTAQQRGLSTAAAVE
jgi:hypothetical protein